MRILIIALLLVCTTNPFAQAQREGDKAAVPEPRAALRVTAEDSSDAKRSIPPDVGRRGYISRDWTSVEMGLSAGMLVFALIVLLLLTSLISKSRVAWAPMSVIRAYGLVLLVTGAIVLITAGYSVEQISPAMGLLGAVSGYLLGSTESAGKQPPHLPAPDTAVAP